MGPPAAVVASSAQRAPMNQIQPQAGATANSLWRTGARAFFIDQRASRIGDILTVNIEIDDSAKTTNASNSSRSSSSDVGVPHFFGLESSLGRVLPGGYD